jgi:sn-glycerol 3-phosphate transport system substrate-binding protein
MRVIRTNNSRRLMILVLVLLVALAALPMQAIRAQQVEINFYFPEATANNAQAIFEGYAAQFSEKNPTIKVNVAYQGSYTDNRTKIQTELKAGAGPDVAVMLTTDLFSFVEDDYLVPAQQFIDQMPDGKAFVEDFFPAFWSNSLDEKNTLWAVPFQRSTPVLYYNKTLFKEAGLNPEKAPANRDELIAIAKQLTTADRWGLWLPSEGFPIWLFTASAIAFGQNLSTNNPADVTFNTPAAQSALELWLALAKEHKVMPEGALSWGDTPTIFTSGKAAMAFHTTGSLTRILNEAPFEVGVAFLPFGPADAPMKGYGAVTGGGNLYIFKNSAPDKQAAAWQWIEFLASPEIQADWGARTGYVAARMSAWTLDPLKTLAAEKPQYAVARDQLEFAQKEFSAFRTIDLQGIINKTLSEVIAGTQTDISAALAAAQSQIDDLLKEYK